MDNNLTKILLAGLVGGVVIFFMGFLLYGVALMGFFEGQTTQNVARTDMVWWSLVLGNLLWGMLVAYVFGKWANITNPMTGLQAGAILGLLMGGAVDLTIYGTSDMMTLVGVMVDILVWGVMTGVAGAVVAWMLGRGAK